MSQVAGAALFVKICGVRSAAGAQAAVSAGADAIGFNFWPRSRRQVSLDEARRIAADLPPSLRRFGVFVDPTAEEVAAALASGAIDTVQFHGDETLSRCAATPGRWMKALRLDAASLAAVDHWPCELLLVDAVGPGYGGSGRVADWALAARAARRRKILLAGGLTPANVAAAVAEVRPFGVDVASGVESAPGVQDPALIAAFVRAARAATSP